MGRLRFTYIKLTLSSETYLLWHKNVKPQFRKVQNCNWHIFITCLLIPVAFYFLYQHMYKKTEQRPIFSLRDAIGGYCDHTNAQEAKNKSRKHRSPTCKKAAKCAFAIATTSFIFTKSFSTHCCTEIIKL